MRAALEPPAPPAVVEWRFDVLERAGYDPVSALRLALDAGVDLHAACDLVAAGCSQRLALAILR